MIHIERADILAALAGVPDNTFHAVLTDPPYGLSFMGKHWDYDVPSVEVWREIVRVLRPGGAVLSFGGTRTYHRLVCNAEDGGLEVRDQLCWLYAKGFPKSLNVSKALDNAAGAERPVIGTQTLGGTAAMSTKEKGGTFTAGNDAKGYKITIDLTGPASPEAKTWDGYGTALKPAHEPILLARKPLDGTVAENVLRWGCGALDIDGCRIGHDDPVKLTSREAPRYSGVALNAGKVGGIQDTMASANPEGRWPANLLLDEGAAEVLDATVGERKSGTAVLKNGGGNKIWKGKNTLGPQENQGYSDSGGPSRFFFSSKVSTRERNEGCDALPLRTAGEVTDREGDTDGLDSPRAGAGRTGGARNHHPTLKPIGLTRYLAQLIRPPVEGAAILIPYAGAGSEVIGAALAGWTNILGIEREADYVAIAKARLAFHLKDL